MRNLQLRTDPAHRARSALSSRTGCHRVPPGARAPVFTAYRRPHTRHLPALALTLALIIANVRTGGADGGTDRSRDTRYVWIAHPITQPDAGALAEPLLVVQTQDGRTVATSNECAELSQDGERWVCGRIAVNEAGTFVVKLTSKNQPASDAAVTLNPNLRLTASTFDVALLLDASHSMKKNDPNDLRLSATEQFWRLARASRRIKTLSIVLFRDDVTVLLEPTAPRQIEQLPDVLRRLRPRGSTDFNAPFQVTAKLFRQTDAEQHAVLFLSDGQPMRRYRATHKLLGEVGCPVYTIGLSPEADSDLLSRIAHDTNGRFFEAPTAEQLRQIFTQIFRIIESPRSVVHRLMDIEERAELPLRIDETMHNPILTIAPLAGAFDVELDDTPLPRLQDGLAFQPLGPSGSRQHLLRLRGNGRILCDLIADTDVVLEAQALRPEAPAGTPLMFFFFLTGGEQVTDVQAACEVRTPGGEVLTPQVVTSPFGLYRATCDEALAPGRYSASVELRGALQSGMLYRQTMLLFLRVAEAAPREAVKAPPITVAKSALDTTASAAMTTAPVGPLTADASLSATFSASPSRVRFTSLYPGVAATQELELLVHTPAGAAADWRVEQADGVLPVELSGTLHANRRSTLTLTATPGVHSAGQTLHNALIVSTAEQEWRVPIDGHVCVPTIEADLSPLAVGDDRGSTTVSAAVKLALKPQGVCPLTIAGGRAETRLEPAEHLTGPGPAEAKLRICLPTPSTQQVWADTLTVTGPGLVPVSLPVTFQYGSSLAQRSPPAIAPVPTPVPAPERFPLPMLLALLFLLLLLLLLLASLRMPARTLFLLASLAVHVLVLCLVLPRAQREISGTAAVTTMTVTSAPPLLEESVPAETAAETTSSAEAEEAAENKEDAVPEPEAEQQARAVETESASAPDATATPVSPPEEQAREALKTAALQTETDHNLQRKREQAELTERESQSAAARKALAQLRELPAVKPKLLEARAVDADRASPSRPTEVRLHVQRPRTEPSEVSAALEHQMQPRQSVQADQSQPLARPDAPQATETESSSEPTAAPALKTATMLEPPQPSAAPSTDNVPPLPQRPAAADTADIASPSPVHPQAAPERRATRRADQAAPVHDGSKAVRPVAQPRRTESLVATSELTVSIGPETALTAAAGAATPAETDVNAIEPVRAQTAADLTVPAQSGFQRHRASRTDTSLPIASRRPGSEVQASARDATEGQSTSAASASLALAQVAPDSREQAGLPAGSPELPSRPVAVTLDLATPSPTPAPTAGRALAQTGPGDRASPLSAPEGEPSPAPREAEGERSSRSLQPDIHVSEPGTLPGVPTSARGNAVEAVARVAGTPRELLIAALSTNVPRHSQATSNSGTPLAAPPAARPGSGHRRAAAVTVETPGRSVVEPDSRAGFAALASQAGTGAARDTGQSMLRPSTQPSDLVTHVGAPTGMSARRATGATHAGDALSSGHSYVHTAARGGVSARPGLPVSDVSPKLTAHATTAGTAPVSPRSVDSAGRDGLGDMTLPSQPPDGPRRARTPAGSRAAALGPSPARLTAVVSPVATPPAVVPRQLDTPAAAPPTEHTSAAVSSIAGISRGPGDRGFGRNRWPRTFPNLQHSGDWDCDRTAMLNLAHQFEKRTGSILPFDSRNVKLDAPDAQQAPFLFMSGHTDFRFTDQEVVRLRAYLQEGGYLWINDSTDVGDTAFDQAARRELQRVLPQAALRKIPPDHALFKGPYDLTTGYKGYPLPPGDKYRQEYLEGIWIDRRLKVIYTRNDYGDGLEIDERTAPLMTSLTDLTPYEMQESSVRMGTNIAMYCINDGQLGDLRFANAREDTEPSAAGRASQRWVNAPAELLASMQNVDGWQMPPGWQGTQFLKANVRRMPDTTNGLTVEFALGQHSFQSWRSQATIGHACSFRFTRDHVILLDVTSHLPGGGRVAIAFTGQGAVPYIETAAAFVRPGPNPNIAFDLGAKTFKTQQTGWANKAPWPDDLTIDTMYLITYPQGEEGRVDLENLRFVDKRRK